MNKILEKLRTKPQRFSKIKDLKILKEIGSGGFGNVYLVEDKIGVEYACKHIDLKALHPFDFENIVQEIKLHQDLDHPHIVKLIDYFIDDDNLCIILEYCEGGNLFQKFYKTK